MAPGFLASAIPNELRDGPPNPAMKLAANSLERPEAASPPLRSTRSFLGLPRLDDLAEGVTVGIGLGGATWLIPEFELVEGENVWVLIPMSITQLWKPIL